MTTKRKTTTHRIPPSIDFSPLADVASLYLEQERTRNQRRIELLISAWDAIPDVFPPDASGRCLPNLDAPRQRVALAVAFLRGAK